MLFGLILWSVKKWYTGSECSFFWPGIIVIAIHSIPPDKLTDRKSSFTLEILTLKLGRRVHRGLAAQATNIQRGLAAPSPCQLRTVSGFPVRSFGSTLCVAAP